MLVFENTKIPQTRGDLGFCGSCVQRLIYVTTSSLPDTISLRETQQTPPNNKSTVLMERLLTDGGAGRCHTFISALTTRQHNQCWNLDVSFPQILYIFPNPFFVTLYNRYLPTSEMHLLMSPVPQLWMLKGHGQQWSGWCAPPEHHSLQALHFLKCIFHAIYWFKWKKAATNELSTQIHIPPWLVLNLSQLAKILPIAPLVHASSPIPLSGTACSDQAQQLLSFLVQWD